MERVAVLISKLQQQLTQGNSVQNMLVTAQLLHAELLLEGSKNNGSRPAHVAVTVPGNVNIPAAKYVEEPAYKPVPKPDVEPVPEPDDEPVSTPQPHPGPRPEPEPAPMPPMVEARPWQNIPAKKTAAAWPVDPVAEVPTLAHQDKVVYELNDTMTTTSPPALNDRLREEQVERAAVLQDTPIRDLKKAISINERHQFINELFRGDETMYERSIKTINSFNIYAEAEYWIQRELKLKVGWASDSPTVKNFDQLVKRRFA